ncbi:MAG: hypothetical protein R3330_17555, partial [Saprospiraceae bacterium]|nr:hypothetical protein [Saprospiraceae bacterium]
MEVGAGTLGAAPLVVEQFRTALDCTEATVTPLEECLGFTAADPATRNDGNAVLGAGNFSVTGAACDGHVFTFNHAGTAGTPLADPNLITIDVSPPVDFTSGQRCFLEFDVVLNNYGTVLDTNPSFPGVQFVFGGAGFNGLCGATSAFPRASIEYQFRSLPNILIDKLVSVDGGPFLDAGVGINPTSTGEYRLVVTNPATTVDPVTGTVIGETLVGVVINDPTLGLIDVPLPADCEPFEPGDTCIIDSGDIGFGNLGGVDVCQNYPEPYPNQACADGEGTPSGVDVQDCDTATVECVEPLIDIIKYVWDPATASWVDANSPNGPTYPVGAVVSYRLEVCNIGDVAFTDALVSDDDLGIPPTSIG